MSERQRSDYWELVKDEFDEKLPRRTAVLVKEEDFSLPFAYPSEFSSIGWLFDNREATTYDESPVASMRFAEYSFPDLTGKRLAKNTFYFGRMQYLPSLVRREIVFSNIGIEGAERFGQSPEGGGFFWDIDLTCQNYLPYVFEKKLYSVVSLARPDTRTRSASGNTIEIDLGGQRLFISSNHDSCGIYETYDDCLSDLADGAISSRRRVGKYIVLEHKVELDPQQRKKIQFGIGLRSSAKAAQGLRERKPERKIREKWNDWFAVLPELPFESEEDRKAYYKCWWVVRLNYYKHPRWGRTVLEALPVYRGYWQWSLPAVEWHSSRNPEIGPTFVRTLLNMFLKYQREDGYVSHALYLTEKIPGESWAERSTVQTPHIPWVALRYYYATKDAKSLRDWYPRLAKYYQYLNGSRDDYFLKLHLWAILSSYDSGLDTTAAFQKVMYGESGAKEKFCYPAIFAAERCRFEQAMGRMARILANDEEETWHQRAELTRDAMSGILWDERRHWYGVLHEDGSLDTRVGVDGLFPFSYGLVDPARAKLARENFLKLLGEYGVFTVAPDEPGFCEEVYWRGPAWTKSCSLAMAAAFNYYPDLMKRVKDALVKFVLKYPSVWECMSARTGKIARGDMGLMATPVVSSNVGAGEAIGALLTYYGSNVFSIDGEQRQP